MKHNSEVSKKLEELNSLTSSMDIPVFRRRDVFWLSKNMDKRNQNHKNFFKAKEIVLELMKMGVR